MSMSREVPLVHPDTILLEDWLKPLGISQYALAQAIGVPRGKRTCRARARVLSA